MIGGWRVAATVLLAALLCGALAAAEPERPTLETEPTRVNWPGGMLTVAEAVDLLAINGNEVSLRPGSDGDHSAYLPPIAGSWWQAVLTIRATFGLRILPPRRYRTYPGYDPADSFKELVVETGPLVLAPTAKPVAKPTSAAPTAAELAAWLHAKTQAVDQQEATEPAALFAAGPYLVQLVDAAVATTTTYDGVRHNAALTVRLRLEPRWNLSRLGPSQVRWLRARTVDGTSLHLAEEQNRRGGRHRWGYQSRNQPKEDGDRPEPTVCLLPEVPADTSGFAISATVNSEILAEVSSTVVLVPGQRRSLDLGGHRIDVHLLADGMAQANGHTRGGLGFSYSRSAGIDQRPEVRLTTLGGKALSSSGGRSSSNGQELTRFTYFRGITAQAYRLTLSMEMVETKLEREFTIPVVLP